MVRPELVHEGCRCACALRRTYAAKQAATFCLEPPGFGPERKAMVDALTLGCIQVLFLPHSGARVPSSCAALVAVSALQSVPQRLHVSPSLANFTTYPVCTGQHHDGDAHAAHRHIRTASAAHGHIRMAPAAH